jgi:peroxiredoxin
MATQATHADLGLKAPPFSLPATDGKTHSLADLKGARGTLVMFI